MNATKRKSPLDKYRVPLTPEGRESLETHLYYDRFNLYANRDYNPGLGNRRKELRKQIAKIVVRLVLGRTEF